MQSTTTAPTVSRIDNCLVMPNDGRGLSVGQTGSGKSTLNAVLIEDKQNLVIVDPKHMFFPRQEYVIVYDEDELPEAARRAEGKALLYRPSIEGLAVERIDRVFQWIFKRRNTFTYLDEITTIIPNPQRFPPYLRAIYTQGRGLGCGILSATQRPSGIPGWFYTESERFWKFFLSHKADQERMAEYMGSVVLEPPDFQDREDGGVHSVKHSFFFYEVGSKQKAELRILEV